MHAGGYEFLRYCLETLLLADDLLDPHSEIAFHHNYFAPGDHAIVEDDVHWLGNGAIEFDDRTGCQFDDILERQLGPAERNADGKLDIKQKVEVLGVHTYERVYERGRGGWHDRPLRSLRLSRRRSRRREWSQKVSAFDRDPHEEKVRTGLDFEYELIGWTGRPAQFAL